MLLVPAWCWLAEHTTAAREKSLLQNAARGLLGCSILCICQKLHPNSHRALHAAGQAL